MGKKGLSKEKKKRLLETDNSMVVARGKEGLGKVKVSKRGINADGRRLDLGW